MKIKKENGHIMIEGDLNEHVKDILMKLIWLIFKDVYVDDNGVRPMTYEAYKAMVNKTGKLL